MNSCLSVGKPPNMRRHASSLPCALRHTCAPKEAGSPATQSLMHACWAYVYQHNRPLPARTSPTTGRSAPIARSSSSSSCSLAPPSLPGPPPLAPLLHASAPCASGGAGDARELLAIGGHGASAAALCDERTLPLSAALPLARRRNVSPEGAAPAAAATAPGPGSGSALGCVPAIRLPLPLPASQLLERRSPPARRAALAARYSRVLLTSEAGGSDAVSWRALACTASRTPCDGVCLWSSGGVCRVVVGGGVGGRRRQLQSTCEQPNCSALLPAPSRSTTCSAPVWSRGAARLPHRWRFCLMSAAHLTTTASLQVSRQRGTPGTIGGAQGEQAAHAPFALASRLRERTPHVLRRPGMQV